MTRCFKDIIARETLRSIEVGMAEQPQPFTEGIKWRAFSQEFCSAFRGKALPRIRRCRKLAVSLTLGTEFSGIYTKRCIVEMDGTTFMEYIEEPSDATSDELDASQSTNVYLCQNEVWSRSDNGSESKLGESEGGPDLRNLVGDLIPKLPAPPSTHLSQASVQSCNIWLNGGTAKTNAHYDANHGVLCVLAGKKRVIVTSPLATPWMEADPCCGESGNHAQVNLLDMSDCHPRIQELSQEFVLETGEAVLIPEGFWHAVESTPGTLALNWWMDGPRMVWTKKQVAAFAFRSSAQALVEEALLSQREDFLQQNLDVFLGHLQRAGDKADLAAEGETAGSDADPQCHTVSSKRLRVEKAMPSSLEDSSSSVMDQFFRLLSNSIEETWASTALRVTSRSLQDLACFLADVLVLKSKETSRTERELMAEQICTLLPASGTSVLLHHLCSHPAASSSLLELLSPQAIDFLTWRWETRESGEERQRMRQSLNEGGLAVTDDRDNDSSRVPIASEGMRDMEEMKEPRVFKELSHDEEYETVGSVLRKVFVVVDEEVGGSMSVKLGEKKDKHAKETLKGVVSGFLGVKLD